MLFRNSFLMHVNGVSNSVSMKPPTPLHPLHTLCICHKKTSAFNIFFTFENSIEKKQRKKDILLQVGGEQLASQGARRLITQF